MNVRESEVAEGVLRGMGFAKADDIESANLILFNTCCIRDLAERKAWGAIGATQALRRGTGDVLIGVFGCLVAQEGMAEEIRRRFPFVDFCFGTNSIHLLPDYIEQARMGRKAFASEIGDANREFDLPAFHNTPPLAYVNIIHGCNNFCTYCIVPHVRGREQSRPADDIVREVEALAKLGYREVTLLGQNVNSYGKDTKNTGFGGLLRRLDKTGISRIRFMTSHPKDLDDDLILAMAQCQSVCKQIHLPVQSGSDAVLGRMNRKYTIERYQTLTAKLRAAMPKVGITTDFIAGFPGETEMDHGQSVELIKAVRFDAAFTFAFSPRKGTAAAKMEGQVDAATKKRRLGELIDVQNGITLALHQSLVGSHETVLIEGISRRSADHVTGCIDRGRTVNFPGEPALVGEMVPVRITRANANSLFAERENGGKA
jgi:tRNA-2-methylthio-N6-dimethylallyladenosine synthase